ncbi:MAG: hypothetical protein WKG00_18205 [Polyangiaceae bacterium]
MSAELEALVDQAIAAGLDASRRAEWLERRASTARRGRSRSSAASLPSGNGAS